MLYFDRLFFSAVFATLIATAALGATERLTAPPPATASAAAAATTPTLEQVVIVGRRDAERT